MDKRKCNWEHPRCKALDCNGRCVALTDTNFPRRTDCPFYDNSAKFKPTAEQQAEKKRSSEFFWTASLLRIFVASKTKPVKMI